MVGRRMVVRKVCVLFFFSFFFFQKGLNKSDIDSCYYCYDSESGRNNHVTIV